jgi:hypothetical protein
MIKRLWDQSLSDDSLINVSCLLAYVIILAYLTVKIIELAYSSLFLAYLKLMICIH